MTTAIIWLLAQAYSWVSKSEGYYSRIRMIYLLLCCCCSPYLLPIADSCHLLPVVEKDPSLTCYLRLCYGAWVCF